MTKKIKTRPGAQSPSAAPGEPLLSKRGKMVIGIGVGVVALGFYIVTFTDPAGRNWASSLCPFVILGGYALIGIGIVTPDPEPQQIPPTSGSKVV